MQQFCKTHDVILRRLLCPMFGPCATSLLVNKHMLIILRDPTYHVHPFKFSSCSDPYRRVISFCICEYAVVHLAQSDVSFMFRL